MTTDREYHIKMVFWWCMMALGLAMIIVGSVML